MERKYPEFRQLELSSIGKEVLRAWKENEVFEKSVSQRAGKPEFTFYEGPPSANGKPGIHHVMARALKDIFCRYKTLSGYQVKRKAGWDTHGLPVELGVEKELGITKEDIGKKISVSDYNEACKKAVMRYTHIWNDLTEKMGYWVNMDDPYITYKPKYMESVWWLLKRLYDDQLIYKGYTIQPYSPKAGTGLSSHELNMPGTYRDVKDTSVIAQFEAVQNEDFEKLFGGLKTESEKVYFVAWTTTPWTLPSNTALTVGKKIDYAMVDTFNQYTGERQNLILAKNLISKYFKAEAENAFDDYNGGAKNIPWAIVWEGKGEDLLGLRYEQLLPYAQPYENPEGAFRVIPGDFVTTEDGTGIVHTAPTFGADDAKVAADAGVPAMLVMDENDNLVPLVDLQGRFTQHMGELGGKYVKNEYYTEGEAPEKSVDVEIAIQLKEAGKAFKVEKYVHSYPHCWRTDKPVLYYPLDSWFIKVTEKKERLVELNKTINWKPKATGEGRFGNWLENANDWNLSRSRYWGVPLPIWSTEDNSEYRVFGSVEELKEACDEAVNAGLMKSHPFQSFRPGDMSEENYDQIDLHRDVVDEVVLLSPSGKPMRREADLIDVWFDSGAMPYAQVHYPFENKEVIDQKKSFPADFIAEGVDQTRGWFYTLHAIGTMVFDSVAYKNVMSNGLVLDKNGQKMSKRLGNAADPFETITKYGPDAVRWYMISNAQPWDNLKFDKDGITEVQRKFFGTLYNTYSFFAMYANIDGFEWNGDRKTNVNERPELDRWILSRLQVLKKKVGAGFEDYEPTFAARAIQEFVDEELSNWYVRLCRRRFWKGQMSTDKQMAYETLYECLFTIVQLMSPVAPFFSDWMYGNLTSHLPEDRKEISVHLTYLEEVNEELIDSDLNDRMQMAQKISSMVFSLRKKEMIKVRQPLQKIMVPVLNPKTEKLVESIADIVLAEVNVKELELMKDGDNILVKRIKPDFKKLGPKFGKRMKEVAGVLSGLDQAEIRKFEEEKTWSWLGLNNEKIEVALEDVEIHTDDIPGWLVMTEGGLTVALDITITDELLQEGIARELINRIQNIRKDSGLEITDRISLKVRRDETLAPAIANNLDYIKHETLAESLVVEEAVAEGQEVRFDDIETSIYLEKI